MRDIKFRAFDLHDGKMKEVSKLTLITRKPYVPSCMFPYEDEAMALEEVELMQYSEVNEAETGREIYEGDIVDYDDSHVMGGMDRINEMRGVVKMLEGCWMIVDDANQQAVHLWSETATVKIVGNVFENSELGFNL